MNSRGTNIETENVFRLFGASSEPTPALFKADSTPGFPLFGSQDPNYRIAPFIKPLDEPTTNMNLLYLPPSFDANPDAFTLEDYEDDMNMDNQTKAVEEENNPESASKIHQGIMKMKALPKPPKFSIKKHLRTAYYAKRR